MVLLKYSCMIKQGQNIKYIMNAPQHILCLTGYRQYTKTVKITNSVYICGNKTTNPHVQLIE